MNDRSVTGLNAVEFGYASAETEYQSKPELLIQGYLDLENMAARVLKERHCLVLGHKGSGKSALSRHLNLVSSGDPLLFVESIYLADFPYSAFTKIMPGNYEPEARYPLSWALLLLLAVLTSLSRDQGLAGDRMDEFEVALGVLRDKGLLPAENLKRIALAASKKNFKIGMSELVAEIGETTDSNNNDLQFIQLVEILKSIVSIPKSHSKHYIIIDGLDDILSARNTQFKTLSALVTETVSLNGLFKREGTNVKIIILCRTELYEKLPGPNKNKFRQDFGLEINWYHDSQEPENSRLFELANTRATLALTNNTDVLRQYFPPRLSGKSTGQWLLEHTRHTPRDFLQLLNHIKRFSNGKRLIKSEVLKGVSSYSKEYFYPEIRDELVGYVTGQEADRFFKLVGSLRQSYFTLEEFQRYKKSHVLFEKKKLDEELIIGVLFDCGAIGNVSNGHYTFKHRNYYSSINFNETFVLHRALTKALNLN